MKTLNLEQMENVNGGILETFFDKLLNPHFCGDLLPDTRPECSSFRGAFSFILILQY
jgi:hypothetical protein